MPTKKVLITGGAGFIGSFVVDALISKGHEVTILDNLEPQVHKDGRPAYLNGKANFVNGDILEYEKVKELVSDTEAILHLASSVGIGQSQYEIKKYMTVNNVGTANILQAVLETKAPVKKLIVASSNTIYGEGSGMCDKHGTVSPKMRTRAQLEKKDWELKCPVCRKTVKPVPTKEDRLIMPNSIYAVTKYSQEQAFLIFGDIYQIPTVALRGFNVYGPRQSLSNPYTGVSAIFSTRIKNNQSPIIYEDGLQSRDFVWVGDVVNAYTLALEKSSADGHALNIASGRATTLVELAETLIRLHKKKLKAEFPGAYRLRDTRHCTADITMAKKLLSYRPKIDFKKGMELLHQWSETQTAEDLFKKAEDERLSWTGR